jgi:hypothetical protein
LIEQPINPIDKGTGRFRIRPTTHRSPRRQAPQRTARQLRPQTEDRTRSCSRGCPFGPLC